MTSRQKAEEEAKEKMMREMYHDAGFGFSVIHPDDLKGTHYEHLFDNLIRSGWRKVSHE
jgi:hypothetical protein